MEILSSHLKNVRVPAGGNKVYKDECMYSFDTPESPEGLFVCMNTFMGVGKQFLTSFAEKTNNKIFLHIKRTKTKRPPDEEFEPEKKIARLAIGIEGGFNANASRKKYDIKEEYEVVVLPEYATFNYPDVQLPDIITMSAEAILKAESPLHLAELEAASQAWDGECREISKHSFDLLQLDNGVKIPASGWKCQLCDKTDNLWLNLTDGAIMCGRRQLDGSGGNNHAIEHYEKTKYPLSVKLGTITPDGNADVFSYTENDMVIDPNLVQHLAHFGIDVSQMEKTEKTLTELEIDYNQRAWEWSRITESGSQLSMKFGPGFTGLQNLGNSCYLNSAMQVLMTVPSFLQTYQTPESCEALKAVAPSEILSSFHAQMIKLAAGLFSGDYSKQPDNMDVSEDDMDVLQQGIAPQAFRLLAGKGHPEFATKRQQDAMEFLEHILKLVTRSSVGRTDPGHVFKFEVEDKLVYSDSGMVKLIKRDDIYLPLPIPIREAIGEEGFKSLSEKTQNKGNTGAGETEQIRHKVPFEMCLSKMAAPESISAQSTSGGGNIIINKFTRLTTFPDYLIIQLVKFGFNERGEPVKYDVSVDMPDLLDLSLLRSEGLAPGEVLAPEDPEPNPEPQVNAEILSQLKEMGFPENACRKAIILTENSGLQPAMDWVMTNIGSPDFDTPLPSQKKSDGFVPNEEGLGMLTSMGFTNQQATLALKNTSNNLERAADWIFSHQSELDSLVQQEFNEGSSETSPSEASPCLTNGDPQYELVAFISHMGTSIHVGHYVCHIKKNGEWTLFNDNKVLASQNPPKDLGYIYFYKRK